MFSSSEKLALNWLANRRALARVGNTEQANLYKTSYAYSNLTYGRKVIRTEQTYSGGWNDDNQVTYRWDSLSRQEYEQRDDWNSGAMPPAWSLPGGTGGPPVEGSQAGTLAPPQKYEKE